MKKSQNDCHGQLGRKLTAMALIEVKRDLNGNVVLNVTAVAVWGYIQNIARKGEPITNKTILKEAKINGSKIGSPQIRQKCQELIVAEKIIRTKPGVYELKAASSASGGGGGGSAAASSAAKQRKGGGDGGGGSAVPAVSLSRSTTASSSSSTVDREEVNKTLEHGKLLARMRESRQRAKEERAENEKKTLEAWRSAFDWEIQRKRKIERESAFKNSGGGAASSSAPSSSLRSSDALSRLKQRDADLESGKSEPSLKEYSRWQKKVVLAIEKGESITLPAWFLEWKEYHEGATDQDKYDDLPEEDEPMTAEEEAEFEEFLALQRQGMMNQSDLDGEAAGGDDSGTGFDTPVRGGPVNALQPRRREPERTIEELEAELARRKADAAQK